MIPEIQWKQALFCRNFPVVLRNTRDSSSFMELLFSFCPCRMCIKFHSQTAIPASQVICWTPTLSKNTFLSISDQCVWPSLHVTLPGTRAQSAQRGTQSSSNYQPSFYAIICFPVIYNLHSQPNLSFMINPSTFRDSNQISIQSQMLKLIPSSLRHLSFGMYSQTLYQFCQPILSVTFLKCVPPPELLRMPQTSLMSVKYNGGNTPYSLDIMISQMQPKIV